jgi:peptide/nickel transport system ATP-binding protein
MPAETPGPPRESAATAVPPLSVQHVSKTYTVRHRDRGRRKVTAVQDVSFDIAPGAAIGLVGASGSGKSTLAKMITGSERPTDGRITFGDIDIGHLHARGLRRLHRRVQMVFQDPYGALNPLHTVRYTLGRPCQNYLGMSAEQAAGRSAVLLETVGLTRASLYDD